MSARLNMNIHEEHMRRAVEAAFEGMRARRGGPFGAALADPSGELVVAAHNEVLGTRDCTMHAEVVALRRAGRLDLRGYTLYATGFPCVMCLGAILWARVSVLYYCNDYAMTARAGFDDAAFLEDVGRVFHCSPSPAGEVELPNLSIRRLFLPEGAALYEEWNSMQDRELY